MEASLTTSTHRFALFDCLTATGPSTALILLCDYLFIQENCQFQAQIFLPILVRSLLVLSSEVVCDVKYP